MPSFTADLERGDDLRREGVVAAVGVGALKTR